MIAKYAIALIVLIVLAAALTWAFLPARYLPGNRARHLRIRLHLRLHPGKGFAHVFSLWLRWGRLAVLRRSGRIRPSLPLWYRITYPGQQSVFLGRAHYRHGLRVPLEEHLLVMAPPRTHKTSFLADVVLDYPGPVIATSTKPDLYALTGAVRAQHGRVHVFNPQHIGAVASTFCWDPVAGCEDPATAIRRADAFAFAVSQKGVEDGTFWSAKAGLGLSARVLLCRRPGPLRPAHGRRLGVQRRPGRPRADPARRRGPPVGPHPGRTPLGSP
jgi:type IV secretion system protein VirD4